MQVSPEAFEISNYMAGNYDKNGLHDFNESRISYNKNRVAFLRPASVKYLWEVAEFQKHASLYPDLRYIAIWFGTFGSVVLIFTYGIYFEI